jgi:hypothetical protein
MEEKEGGSAHPCAALIAERGWQGDAERERGRARRLTNALTPKRERLINKHRRLRAATRNLLHLE